MIRKRIVYILLLALTLNALSVFSAPDTDLPSSDLLNTALETESSLVSAMTLSCLPVKIITLLVSENGLLAPVLQKHLPVKRSEEKKQRTVSADPVLMDRPANSIIRSIVGGTALFLPYDHSERVLSVVPHADVLPEAGDTLVLFLLGYLVVLAMSHLPWDFKVINLCNRTILSSGFFIV